MGRGLQSASVAWAPAPTLRNQKQVIVPLGFQHAPPDRPPGPPFFTSKVTKLQSQDREQLLSLSGGQSPGPLPPKSQTSVFHFHLEVLSSYQFMQKYFCNKHENGFIFKVGANSQRGSTLEGAWAMARARSVLNPWASI